MLKQGIRLIILGIILSLAHGCGTGSKAHYPTYPYPRLPNAIKEPEKVWLSCGDMSRSPKAVTSDMICVDPVHVEQIRVFIIELDAVVRKYENAINTINK